MPTHHRAILAIISTEHALGGDVPSINPEAPAPSRPQQPLARGICQNPGCPASHNLETPAVHGNCPACEQPLKPTV